MRKKKIVKTVEPPEAFFGKPLFVLVGLIISGVILRFYNLGFNSIWLDEAVTYETSGLPFLSIWNTISSGDFNPPLFYFMEHVMLLSGNSEIILRFLPALFGVATIPIFYLIGREVIDDNGGIIAATIITFSYFHIYYSQEARAYSIMLFFVSLAFLFFLMILRDSTTTNWVLFGAAAAIAFWLHFYSIVMIMALCAYIMAYRKDTLAPTRSFLVGALVFVLACVPIFILIAQRFATRAAIPFSFGNRGFAIITETFYQMTTFGGIGSVVIGVLFFLGLVVLYRNNKSIGTVMILVISITFIVSYLLSYKMPMMPRHLVFLFIVLCIGIAASYKAFFLIRKTNAIIYTLMIAMILINIPALSEYYTTYSKEDWRGFSAQLTQTTGRGDIIVTVPSYIEIPLTYYYSNVTDGTTIYGFDRTKDLDTIPTAKNTFYVVTGDIMAQNPDGSVIGWLKSNTQYVGQNYGISIFVRTT